MTGIPLTLFHFLTFTFGFTALILISRKNNLVSPAIRKSFFNQALFYNLTIITMTVVDIMILLSVKGSVVDKGINVFVSVMANINNALYVLWCLSFVVLIYWLLGITLNKRLKTIIGSVAGLFMLMVIYNLAGSLRGDRSVSQEATSDLLCFSSISVLCYSLFLIRKSSLPANQKRKKALRSFGILFTGFSIITLAFYTDTIVLRILPRLVNNMLIYFIDFTYNAILVIWSLNYLEAAGMVAEGVDLKDLSTDQLVVKYQISKREQEIIQFVCSGKSNQEIADLLFITLGTVKNHIYNIYTKLGIKNRAQLVRMFGGSVD